MKPDFSKSPDQLIPAVIQDAKTQKVLMLGYMNEAAFEATQKSQKGDLLQSLKTTPFGPKERRVGTF